MIRLYFVINGVYCNALVDTKYINKSIHLIKSIADVCMFHKTTYFVRNHHDFNRVGSIHLLYTHIAAQNVTQGFIILGIRFEFKTEILARTVTYKIAVHKYQYISMNSQTLI